MTTSQRSVVPQPQALARLAHGVELFAAPLAVTLGPRKGFVVNERTRREIELLTDSYTIARRVISLPGREDNLGAMLLRRMVIGLHDRYGDGVATAVVMVRAMVQEAVRLVAAGVNPALMAHGLKLAVEAAQTALAAQARPVAHLEELVALAQSVTGDPALGEVLGQMFDTMGEHATIITQDTPSSTLDYEYVRGAKWDGYLPARQILPEGEVGLVLHDPLIVLVNEELSTIAQVQPMLELALADPARPPLLVLARAISGDALTMLTANHVRGVLTVGMLVLSSGMNVLHDDLEDIAALTGGRVLSAVTGHLAGNVQATDLGRAHRAILSEIGVTLAGGAGDAQMVQLRIAGVRAELRQTLRGQEGNWDFLRVRLARLTGGVGVLKLTGFTDQERTLQKEQIARALRMLDSAYEQGLVPGGGTAFLACLPALEQARAACQQDDERFGVSLVTAALQAPFLQIVRNHGELHPPLALDQVQRLGPGYGFDALHGDFVCMAERHILDCLSMAQETLAAAASVATMIITTDTLVFTL